MLRAGIIINFRAYVRHFSRTPLRRGTRTKSIYTHKTRNAIHTHTQVSLRYQLLFLHRLLRSLIGCATPSQRVRELRITNGFRERCSSNGNGNVQVYVHVRAGADHENMANDRNEGKARVRACVCVYAHLRVHKSIGERKKKNNRKKLG